MHNQSITVNIRNVNVNTIILFDLRSHSNFTNCPHDVFSDPGSSLGSHVAFVLVSLWFPLIWNIPLLFLAFHDMDIFEECRPGVRQNVLRLDLSDVFSGCDLGCVVLGGYQALSVLLIRRQVLLFCPFTVMLTLSIWLRW